MVAILRGVAKWGLPVNEQYVYGYMYVKFIIISIYHFFLGVLFCTSLIITFFFLVKIYFGIYETSQHKSLFTDIVYNNYTRLQRYSLEFSCLWTLLFGGRKKYYEKYQYCCTRVPLVVANYWEVITTTYYSDLVFRPLIP